MREERLKEKSDKQEKVINVLRDSVGYPFSEIGARRDPERKERGADDSNQEVSGWRDKAREHKAEAGRLKCRVRRFERFERYAHHANPGVCRFDSRVSYAIGNAVEAEKASSNVLEIKDKGGVIKNEFREAIAELRGHSNNPRYAGLV